MAAAYSKANELACYGDRNDHKWQRSLHNCWKFNCDGAFNPSDKSATFAVLVRDSEGAVVEINHGRIKVYGKCMGEERLLLNRIVRCL